ncbi:hypothetical protein UFOVP291_33 [uncultured Caudovirales phage]|uniref:Uncharacterized protein n=1 Tax=uncultured Caudovirales phage TaxID=2100421 RepID=A0A6J5LP70_9CAUD|nr:hypothetical protein UFOVP291_33 [uncultured Caudovirales phage]
MADYSWIEPSTKNIANLFGLNPEAAAKGRAMQSEQEYNAARTANTQADTGLSPYRQRLLEAQAATQAAMAGQHKEAAGKTAAERAGIELATQSRQRLNELYSSGALVQNEDGSVTISPKAVGGIAGSLAALQTDPVKTMQSIREVQAGASTNPRFAAQTRGIAGIFRPDAATTAGEGQQIMGDRYAASQNQAVEVAKARGIAAALAKGGQPGQPNQMELNRQAEGIKAGAEWAMKVPFQGGFLDEGQAYQLAQAARAANPSLNPQDAITKFVRDNPNMLKGDSEWFGKNKVDFPAGIPVTVPAAPAARPVAPAPATAEPVRITNDDSGKAAYARLPSGTPFVDPNGQRRIKP